MIQSILKSKEVYYSRYFEVNIMKTKTIRQIVSFDATPEEVYEAYMDSKKHSQFTGAKAKVSRKIGGSFSAYEGELTGKNLKLIPDRLIVQKWRCETEDQQWPKKHFSKLTLKLAKAKKGTKLTMIHAGVPSICAKDINSGWKKFYWQPMKKLLK